MNKIIVKENKKIEDLIYEIRGKQVMLDSDLAKLYKCTNGTKDINKAVKRNIEKFPNDFYFILTEEEYKSILRFHFGTLELEQGKYSKYLPHVFTEQGVAMLSSVLKTSIASEVSVNIMRAFVAMRKFINNNREMFTRMISMENDMKFLSDKQNKSEKDIQYIFDKLENKEHIKEKLFLDGQIYDAYSLLINIIMEAKKEIIIIDNYVDKRILDILLYKNENVKVKIYTRNVKSKLDIETFNLQYPRVEINKIEGFHDRFIILDNETLYHVGASLKDLGKKCFALNKMNKEFINGIKTKLNK